MTKEQLEAVHSAAPVTLAVACAGSGKTTVLVHRIRYLLDLGIDPNRLLAITFTRAAAKNMRKRLVELLGGDDKAQAIVLRIQVSTVHALALRILQAWGSKLGYDGPRISILDESDRDMLIESVCDELGFLRSKKWRFGLSRIRVDRAIEAYDAGEWQASRPFPSHEDRIIQRYKSVLFAENLMTFGDLLRECRRLFTEHPDVLAMYRKQYEQVLVDEFQDSSSIEYSLFESFCPPANLFGVGDTRQSIYGFRWARPDLMRGLLARDGASLIDLAKSFRCADSICRVANNLIEKNGDTLAAPMIGATGRKGMVELVAGNSDTLIETLHEKLKLYKPHEVAVLARKHDLLIEFEAACCRGGIPAYRVGKRFDACDSIGFRIFLATLRLKVNPRDDLSFRRLCSLKDWPADYLHSLRAVATASGISMYEAAASVGKDPLPQFDADDFVTEAAEACTDPQTRDFWNWHCADMTVGDAVAWYSLHARHREAQEDLPAEGAVLLMTVHAAKGLEFPCVFVIELNEGIFPSSQSIRGGEESIQEERRLGYVAMTRAAELLCLHYRREHEFEEFREPSAPSRFLEECGVMHREAVA